MTHNRSVCIDNMHVVPMTGVIIDQQLVDSNQQLWNKMIIVSIIAWIANWQYRFTYILFDTISDPLYWKSYPNDPEEPPKVNGTTQIHKHNHPVRPIVSCCGSVTHKADKCLSNIFTPSWVTNAVSRTAMNVLQRNWTCPRILRRHSTLYQRACRPSPQGYCHQTPSGTQSTKRTTLSIQQITVLIDICLKQHTRIRRHILPTNTWCSDVIHYISDS